jgi:hypothetical protein
MVNSRGLDIAVGANSFANWLLTSADGANEFAPTRDVFFEIAQATSRFTPIVFHKPKPIDCRFYGPCH